MSKIAFVFSGQGAQSTGMGKELYDNFPVVKEIFDTADNLIDEKITQICFDEQKKEMLDDTKYCQSAILTLSYACGQLLKQYEIFPEVVAGLSLGEYSALCYSEVFSFKDSVKLVRKRGELMANAVEKGVGAMSAILGLTNELAEKACEDSQDIGYVICANYNATGQIVIAGETNAVARAEELSLQYGAKKAVRLNVSGPFHTEMLKDASLEFVNYLNKIEIKEPKYKIITNTTANEINITENFKQDLITNLQKQMISPVLWEKTMTKMLDDGIDTIIELGVGKTLLSFAKSVSRDFKLLNVCDVKSLEKTIETLKK